MRAVLLACSKDWSRDVNPHPLDFLGKKLGLSVLARAHEIYIYAGAVW